MLMREVLACARRALLRSSNALVSTSSPIPCVMPRTVIQFICGESIDADQVSAQQQVHMFATSERYRWLALRARGSSLLEIGPAFDAMRTTKPPLPPAVERLLRLMPVVDFDAEQLGSILVKGAARAGGFRATRVVRCGGPKVPGYQDGGFDDLFRLGPRAYQAAPANPPLHVAQQSFGGAFAGMASDKKLPVAAASCLITPEGSEEQTRPKKRRKQIFASLMDDDVVRLLLLGFHKSAPGGPHIIIERRNGPEREPHMALSSLVSVFVTPDEDELRSGYEELTAAGLVRSVDDLIWSWRELRGGPSWAPVSRPRRAVARLRRACA